MAVKSTDMRNPADNVMYCAHVHIYIMCVCMINRMYVTNVYAYIYIYNIYSTSCMLCMCGHMYHTCYYYTNRGSHISSMRSTSRRHAYLTV